MPHRYRVCTVKDSLRYYPPLPEYVILTTKTGLPLPNPEYLGLHALCCEVAWKSGAAEYIMNVERKMDDTKVLADDGSTADLLMAALSLVDFTVRFSPANCTSCLWFKQRHSKQVLG